MNDYLARLKQKLGKAEAVADHIADPFVGFVGAGGEHVGSLKRQPLVVKYLKKSNTVLTDKTFKRSHFTSRGDAELSLIATHEAEPKLADTVALEVVATVEPASSAAVTVDDTALAAFKLKRPYGVPRFRHDQACWAAEMFLNEWQGLAAEFGWSNEDIFAAPRNGKSGLAYWLGTDVVTALGPDHAGTESNRVFDRTTRGDWINPCQAETRQ